jgi:hypothetical protein
LIVEMMSLARFNAEGKARLLGSSSHMEIAELQYARCCHNDNTTEKKQRQ